MSNLFDLFNSYGRHEPGKQLEYDGSEEQLKQLDEFFRVVDAWVFLDRQGKQSRLPCQEGWLLNISALKMMFSELKCEDFRYLITTRLNQDSLESIFSSIRRTHGFNPRPNPVQFMSAVKKIVMTGRLENIGNTSYEMDCSPCLFEVHSQAVSCSTSIELPLAMTDAESNINVQALKYVGGYIALKLKRKLCCEQCDSLICNAGENIPITDENMFIFCKKYCEEAQILEPIGEFWTAVRTMEELFQKYRSALTPKYPIKKTLKAIFSRTLIASPLCENHADKICLAIDIFLNLRVHQWAFEMNRLDRYKSRKRKFLYGRNAMKYRKLN